MDQQREELCALLAKSSAPAEHLHTTEGDNIQKAVETFARAKDRVPFAQAARAATQYIEDRTKAPLSLFLVGLCATQLDEDPTGTITYTDDAGKVVLAKDVAFGSKALEKFVKLGAAVSRLKGEGEAAAFEVLLYCAKECAARLRLPAGEAEEGDEEVFRGVLCLLRLPPLDVSRTGEFFQRLVQHHREHPELAQMDTEKATPVDWFLLSFLGDDGFPLTGGYDEYAAFFKKFGASALRVFRVVWAMMGLEPGPEEEAAGGEGEASQEEEEEEEEEEKEEGSGAEGASDGKRQRTQ
eukprot:tig00000857_g4947.t1